MKGFLPSFALLCLLIANSLAADAAYEVSGHITTVAPAQGNRAGTTHVRPFAVAVDGAKVFIRTLIQDLIGTNTVAATKRQSFISKLSRATEVLDYRYAAGSGQPARYLATNGIVLYTEEEAWAEAHRQAEEKKPKEE